MGNAIARFAWPALYAAVALAVAGPLLAPGYVFALDHAMGPASAAFYANSIAHNADPIQSKGGYAVLLRILDMLMPMWLAQKFILFLPFFLAGYGAHKMVERRVSAPATVFAGLLYALGPFAYVRGVSGQTGVLWAYALAPWFLSAWLRFVETGERRALVVASLLVAATLVFQAHGAVLLALLVAAHTLVRLLRAPRAWTQTLRAPLALAGWSVVLNLYWLVPVLLARETTLSLIGGADQSFFATTSAGLPSVGLAALTLQGFWREAYASPFAARWLLVFPAIVLLLTVRALFLRREDAAVGVALAGGIGLVLAIGANSRWTAWLTDAIWDHVPLMRGFRESHKLLALLALAYAYLAPVGFDSLLAAVRELKLPRLAPVALAALLLAAPVAVAAPLLGGYHGQLGVVAYPEEWAQVEAATRGCDGAMVVLPWHLYADVSWIPNKDKRVTNPAKLYFSCPTLTSDNLELGAATSQASSPSVAYVDHWMTTARIAEGNPRNITTLGNLLSPVGARYVLLLKDADWQAVAPALDAQRDLRVVLDNGRARLYENDAKLAPALHAVDESIMLRDWDDLVPISEARPLANIAFVMGDPQGSSEDGVKAESPGVVHTPSPRTPRTSWALDGEPATMMSLGFQPGFSTTSVEGRVRDMGAWGPGAAAWMASFVGLGALAFWWKKGARAARGP